MLCWHISIPHIWTGTCSYLEILVFNYYFVCSPLSWALSQMGLFPGRELFVEHWKQESLSPMDAHHPASSLNLAQLVTFYPCQCQWKPLAAWGTCSHPSAKGTTSSKSRARWRQENLIWPTRCWLSYFLVLALQQLLPEDPYWVVTIT